MVDSECPVIDLRMQFESV